MSRVPLPAVPVLKSLRQLTVAAASVCPEQTCKLSPLTTAGMESKSLQMLAEKMNYRRRTVFFLCTGERWNENRGRHGNSERKEKGRGAIMADSGRRDGGAVQVGEVGYTQGTRVGFSSQLSCP